ncbi:hypothetical protein TWF225_004723 [Orbilia oligospora]|nr:hypothetical protein TWF751_009436 [Orbilia oligospora]KAF3186199.1 hypothetical protein TWF225_004723 [Orbilia oligospora]KAF3287181.1 hypothetical protein TWF132_008703 [Orbilia oligospora]
MTGTEALKLHADPASTVHEVELQFLNYVNGGKHASQGRLGAAGRRDVCGPLVFRGLNTRFVSFIYRSYPRRQNLSSNSNSNSSCDSRTPNLYAVPLILQTGRIMSTCVCRFLYGALSSEVPLIRGDIWIEAQAPLRPKQWRRGHIVSLKIIYEVARSPVARKEPFFRPNLTAS